MDFYTIVTICAILLLIIALTTLGVVISYSTSTQEFPKFKNPCPDYWILDGKNNKCISNGINNGVLDTTSTSPPTYKIDKTKSLSEQLQSSCNWANINQIYWDGVSNYNGCIKQR
jgi:hypothetical protein